MKIARFIALFFTTVLAGAAVAVSAAQQLGNPPPAPIPTAIYTAHKVFISNASGEFAPPEGAPELTYDEFYAAMKSWGRYELVSTPADADLVFEISYDFGPVPYLRLLILDQRTHFLLWSIAEQVKPWALAATGRKNFDQAMANLVDDLKKLAAPLPTATSNPSN